MADTTTESPSIQHLQAETLAAYGEIIKGAVRISELAPHELRKAAFAEILRHMLENERMTFMLHAQNSMSAQRQNGPRLFRA